MNYRSLSGKVTDQHHEPLRGAVVEIQNDDDKAVQSFLTDRAGHYSFQRLSANTDYTYWATYRGHRSKSHNLSKFNAKTADVTDLEIKLD